MDAMGVIYSSFAKDFFEELKYYYPKFIALFYLLIRADAQFCNPSRSKYVLPNFASSKTVGNHWSIIFSEPYHPLATKRKRGEERRTRK